MNRKVSLDWILFVLSAVALGLSIFFAWVKGKLDPIAWGVLSPIALSLLNERVSSLRAKKALNDTAAEVQKTLAASVHMRQIGYAEEGLAYLIHAMNTKDVVSIVDSCFRTAHDVAHGETRLRRAFKEAIEGFSKKHPYSLVGTPGGIDIVKDVARNSRFAPKSMVSQIPMINFIIIRHKETPTELLFGWDFDEKGGGPVYLTTDGALINHFARMHDVLMSMATPDAGRVVDRVRT